MVVFHTSLEFYTNRHALSKEAFKEGYKLSKFDYLTQVMIHHLGLDLAFLDEQEEFEGEPSLKHREITMPITMLKVPIAKLINVSKPSPVEGIVAPSEPASTPTNPKVKVGD